jgi:uncharacterized protein Smg (DUF494 family)
MTLIVDPPSGWRYGFPAELQEDYAQQLKDAGYPEKDIPMALKHSRYLADTREELVENIKNNEKKGYYE